MPVFNDNWPKRALVLAAHLDDEVLGAGGAIHYLAKKCGFEVFVLVLSAKTTFIAPDIPRDVDLRERTPKVAEILGISKYYFLNFIDGRIGADMPSLVASAEGLFKKVDPSVVLSHCAHDANQDHRSTYHVTEIISRLFRSKSSLRAVWSYEVVSATNFAIRSHFQPNAFVEIDLEKKLEAVRVYSSEMDAGVGHRNEEGIKAIASYRGMQVGCDAAEGFEVMKMLFRGDT